MKKIFVLLLALAVPLMAQQVNYTYGVNLAGADYGGAGLVYIDTTTGTTNNIYVDINDFYWIDVNPLRTNDTTGAVLLNSDRSVFGTFYCNFDNQGADPTADSVLFTIKVYPGVYSTASKSLAMAKWGTAVTLETIEAIGDQFTVNNVYLHATKYKHFPPEVLKFEIAPIGRADADDSTAVHWRYAYPALLQVHKERKHD